MESPNPPRGREAIPLACDLGALTDEQRRRRALLAERLRKAVVGVTELPNGLSLRIAPGPGVIPDLIELVALENRCCPFLQWSAGGEPDARHPEIEITGGEGVKEFLAAEFGLRADGRPES